MIVIYSIVKPEVLRRKALPVLCSDNHLTFPLYTNTNADIFNEYAPFCYCSMAMA